MCLSLKEFSYLIYFYYLQFLHPAKTFSIGVLILSFPSLSLGVVNSFVRKVFHGLFMSFIYFWPSFTISFLILAIFIPFRQISYLFHGHHPQQIYLSSCSYSYSCLCYLLSLLLDLITFLLFFLIFLFLLISSIFSLNYGFDFIYERKMRMNLQIYINFFSFKLI